MSDVYPCNGCRKLFPTQTLRVRMQAHGAGFVAKRYFCADCLPRVVALVAICTWKDCTNPAYHSKTRGPALGVNLCEQHNATAATALWPGYEGPK